MRLKQLCFAALTCLFVMSSQASAQIVTSDAAPETDILLDTIDGGIVATLIDGTANPGARGAMFQLGAVGESFTLSGFTLEANQAATFVEGNTFTIALYTGDPGGNFAPMTSPGTPENVTPEFLVANSGLTLIHQEDFLGTSATGDGGDGAVGVRDFVTFELSDPVVPGGENITVIVFTNFAFSQVEGNQNGGGRLQLRDTTTALAGSGSRDLRFSVSGVPAGMMMMGIKGDVDGSGEVDFFDIQPFIDVLSTPMAFQAEADVDCNGVVDFFDIQPFIDMLSGAN